MPQQGMFFTAPPTIVPVDGKQVYAVMVDGIKVGEVERNWRGWSHDFSDDVYATPTEAATALVAAKPKRIPRGKASR